MSILNDHRINFFGGIQVDVSLPNNLENYYIDANGNPIPQDQQTDDNSVAIFDSKTSLMTDFVRDNNITDEQILNMLRYPAENSAHEQYFTNGGWNIYGQHSVVTDSVNVSSAGFPGQVSEHSPLSGFPVSLLGSANPDTGQTGVSSAVMVDLNPLGSQYSQIILGGFLVGDKDNPLLHLQGDFICSNIGCGKTNFLGLDQKLLNGETDSPGSSSFTGTWQVTFSKAQIVAYANSGNPTADQLITELVERNDIEGFVVNFTFFEMCPKYTTDQIRESYYTNQNERNPSIGRIVGTIGVAFANETKMYPDGRMLLANVSTDAGGHKLPTNFYATAYASTFATDEGGRFAVNLLTALTQNNFRTVRDGNTSTPIDPAIDVGELTLKAGDTTIGTLTPDYEHYYKFGGIVDMELDSSKLATAQSQTLSLVSAPMGSPNGSPLKSLNLYEQAYRLYSDSKNVYTGETHADTHEVTLVARYLGEVVPSSLNVAVKRVDIDGYNDEDYLDLSTNNVHFEAGQPSATYTLKNAMGRDAVGGFEQVEFSHGDTKYLVNTRKYQHNDFGIASGTTISWDQVYEYALRYHYLNFAGMSTVFPLNLEQTIRQHGEGITLRTSSRYWPTSLYMPIVRSMSPSQVRLLNAFIDGSGWNPTKPI